MSDEIELTPEMEEELSDNRTQPESAPEVSYESEGK